MNTMLSSATDFEVCLREIVLQSAPADMLFCFDLADATDFSLNDAGTLLEQDQDFVLIASSFDGVGRAGPSWVSPRRYAGNLDIGWFTKAPRDKVKYSRLVESVADWFQDQTLQGIRFRQFLPTAVAPLHGFMSYNGVMNFEFEIALTR